MKKCLYKISAILIAIIVLTSMSACGREDNPNVNLTNNEHSNGRIVNLFAPIGKTNPDPDKGNIAITAQEKTVIMAEKKLNLTVEYRTYMAEDYQDKTYDDVTLDRIRNNMDDMYLLNPDTIQTLGMEERLADLSGLESAKNLREVVKTANTVNGKLVAIPQEIVAYGLFINKKMFDEYKLKLPDTPEEFLECCRVFKENGIETPVGANRWWLENFVLAQAYADLYNGNNTKAEIEALNTGKAKYSDYMRPGFEFLQEMIDKKYIDTKKVYTYEAIDGEGPDFKAQKTPIVMAYWGAANADTAYGDLDFDMQVIGFPSNRGQMPVIALSGYGICADAENLEDAMNTLDIMLSDEALQIYTDSNSVISPSKNVDVNCKDELKPLYNKIKNNTYVLGSNASMKVEQWGNICNIVRDLLNGSTVDECMAKFDKLQEESLQ
ncbi:MAG: extracellular solute-binding protein [Firmicutes bacterium]|nr:extracellular solute-binding protein [Bacillota bacterium]